MPSEPSWWYDRERRATAALLAPVAALYNTIAQHQITRAQPYVSRLPVICVGNFTAGGTGKTPLTEYLARYLTQQGARVAILSRGYGGMVVGPHWVTLTGKASPFFGDEPLLLAAHAAVMVSRDRAAGARAIEANARAFTHIVMDDGLQNPALERTLSIAVVDGQRGVGNGRVIPAGPLRASLEFQFGLADAIVINDGGRGAVDAEIEARLQRTFAGPVLSASIEPAGDAITALKNTPLLAFAGIGVPDKFFEMLRRYGLDVRAVRAFPDHHLFVEDEAARLIADAARLGATLVTTAKDHVRLRRTMGARAELALLAREVPVRMTFSAAHASRLDALLAPLLRA